MPFYDIDTNMVMLAGKVRLSVNFCWLPCGFNYQKKTCALFNSKLSFSFYRFRVIWQYHCLSLTNQAKHSVFVSLVIFLGYQTSSLFYLVTRILRVVIHCENPASVFQ